jgi:hypothetical protein
MREGRWADEVMKPWCWSSPPTDRRLMTEKQILGFEPTSRLEYVAGGDYERI